MSPQENNKENKEDSDGEVTNLEKQDVVAPAEGGVDQTVGRA